MLNILVTLKDIKNLNNSAPFLIELNILMFELNICLEKREGIKVLKHRTIVNKSKGTKHKTHSERIAK